MNDCTECDFFQRKSEIVGECYAGPFTMILRGELDKKWDPPNNCPLNTNKGETQ